MKTTKRLFSLGFVPLTYLTLSGCYTQLAVSERVSVPAQSFYGQREAQVPQDELAPDTVFSVEGAADTVVYEHYWVEGPYDPFWFGYDPSFDYRDVYFGFRFTWGNPYRYRWPYRPYGSYWAGYGYPWYWDDFFWYDPFVGYAYSPYYYYPGGYYGWRYPYRSWGWYGTPYYVDPRPQEKRDWDRRGAQPGRDPIIRTDGAVASDPSTFAVAPARLVSAQGTANGATRDVRRNRDDSSREITPDRRTVERPGADQEIRRSKTSDVRKNAKREKAIKRIYHRVVRSDSHRGKESRLTERRSSRVRNTSTVRSSRSSSNRSSVRQVSRGSSGSSMRGHSTSTSSGGRSRGSSSSKRSSSR